MVRVRFTLKSRKTFIRTFPKSTLRDIKLSAKEINPKILKVELAGRKRK